MATLARGFIRHGHEVMQGARSPEKLADWKAGSFADAAAFGEVLVLAVKGKAASDVLRLAGVANLSGKCVIDAGNPIEDAPPDHGVLRFSRPWTNR